MNWRTPRPTLNTAFTVSRSGSAEYAASNLGDDVIDTTNLSIEEAVEKAL